MDRGDGGGGHDRFSGRTRGWSGSPSPRGGGAYGGGGRRSPSCSRSVRRSPTPRRFGDGGPPRRPNSPPDSRGGSPGAGPPPRSPGAGPPRRSPGAGPPRRSPGGGPPRRSPGAGPPRRSPGAGPPRRRRKTRSQSAGSSPRMRKEAFGRNSGGRIRHGERGQSGSPPRRQRHCSCSRSADSRSRSRSRSHSFNGMPGMPGFGPGGFPAMWGGKAGGMPQGMPGFGPDWWKSLADGGKGGPANPWGWPVPSAAAAMGAMWGFPGFPGGMPQPGGGGTDRKGGSRSRSRSQGKSKSDGQGKSVDSLRLPKNVMGRIIGKGGSNIKEIREKSGCRVDAEDRDGAMCEFKLSGQPECVEIARRMILDIVEGGKNEGKGASGGGGYGDYGGYGGGDKAAEDGPAETLDFPITVMGSIIGARGAKIMEVRQMSGARVMVNKEDERCKVVITGNADAVQRAKMMVEELARNAEQQGLDGGGAARAGGGGGRDSGGGGKDKEEKEVVNDTLEFPPGTTGGIIGTRGAKIAEVRQQSGAKVQIEKLEDRCKVQISGSAEQVERAKQLITALAEEVAASAAAPGGKREKPPLVNQEIVDVPLSMIGRVIGKGGETVQRLQVDSGAKIEINARDGSDPVPVKVGGPREAVHRARRLIMEILERGEGPRRGGGGGGGARHDDRDQGRNNTTLANYEHDHGGYGAYPGGPPGPGSYGMPGFGPPDWGAVAGQWPPQMPPGPGMWGGFPSPYDYPAGDGNSDFTRYHAGGGGSSQSRSGRKREEPTKNTGWAGSVNSDIDLDDL